MRKPVTQHRIAAGSNPVLKALIDMETCEQELAETQVRLDAFKREFLSILINRDPGLAVQVCTINRARLARIIGTPVEVT